MQRYLTILLGMMVLLALAGCASSTPTPDLAVIERAVEATLTAMAPPAPSPTSPSALESPPPRPFQPAAETVTVKGDPNAPVTIVEYSDFK